jgi:MSHA pilin protein MshD
MCTEGRVIAASHSKLKIRNSKFGTHFAETGFSLIEAILFMVVVGVALVVLLKAFDQSAMASADLVLRRQSLAIAQSLLEEIAAKDFSNPSPGGYAGPYNAATRNQFDDVMDYNGYTMNGISDLSGMAIAGLSGYRAVVAVAATAFGGVPASAGWRISVTVTDPAGTSLALDGYRANY